MNVGTRADILAHVRREYPREACGLVVNARGHERYRPCRNLAAGRGEFELAPEDYAAAEDAGDILWVVHSHPDASANPSDADRLACEASGLPWVIVGWPSGVWVELRPEGWAAPLEGRRYEYGVLDCHTLVVDYYARECGLSLAPAVHSSGWWSRGEDRYRNWLRERGFVAVEGGPRVHDLVLMRIRGEVPHHGGVITRPGVMLHHLPGRLSACEPYGRFYRNRTDSVWRPPCCAP